LPAAVVCILTLSEQPLFFSAKPSESPATHTHYKKLNDIVRGMCPMREVGERESSGNVNAGFTCPSGELQPLTKHPSDALRSSLGAQRELEICGLSLGR